MRNSMIYYLELKRVIAMLEHLIRVVILQAVIFFGLFCTSKSKTRVEVGTVCKHERARQYTRPEHNGGRTELYLDQGRDSLDR